MPFFSKSSQSKEAKKRYERLLVVAKDNPDRIFDFNSCELSNVPESLFSQCKVFLTESLVLHTNNLKSIGSGSLILNLRSLKVSLTFLNINLFLINFYLVKERFKH